MQNNIKPISDSYKYSESDFFIDSVQLQVYLDNYYYEDEGKIETRFDKVAKTIFDNSDNRKKLYTLCKERKISLGGRILANLGRPELKNTCPFNCYASQRNVKPVDSIECIYEDLKIAAHVLKTEGGIGFDFSHLRPRYTYIKGSGITTPGVVGFMELFDKSSSIITRGNDDKCFFQVGEKDILKKKVRKGAMISLLIVSHPDIIEYIEAKKIPNKLVKFNMSVAITDEFMKCVLEDKDWDLIFPDIHFEKYDEEWDGDFDKWKKKGYPMVVYKTVKARELWNLLLKNMYNRNEPGIYFIDNANKYNNLLYYQRVTGVNPCLSGDTNVTMFDTHTNTIYTKKLKDIKVGEYVLSYNIHKGILQPKMVLWQGLTRKNADVEKVVYKDGSLIKTPDHLIYNNQTKEYSELPAYGLSYWHSELEPKIDYGELKETCIITNYDYGNEDVYDIMVEDNHNFFANGILVHNCGEISMLADPGTVIINGKTIKHMGDICNLGSVVLCNFYDKEKGFLWDDFKDAVRVLVRTLDSIIDIANYPFEELKNSALLRRKIGCGLLGYASLLIMMGYKYGSEKANKFTDKLMYEYVNTAYQESALIAKEKGPFPLYDKDKIFNNGYIRNSGNLSEETLNLIKKYGLRNSQLTTIAPTGNTSMLFGNVSSGCEPVFGLENIRWITATHNFTKIITELNYEAPDITKGEFYETEHFKLDEEGGEEILVSICGNYKIDKHRGLIKKVKCTDYGYKWCLENLSEKELNEYKQKGVFVSAEELTAKEHLDPFIIFSNYVDNSISKTINLKEDYPFEEFNDLFVRLWKSGGRGITTYRAGTMTVVVEAIKESKTKEQEIEKQQEEFYEIWKEHVNNGVVIKNVKLPEQYPMMGYTIRSEGKKWRFHLAFKDKDMRNPFAFFIQTNNIEPNVSTFNTLELLEELALTEGIPKEWVEKTKQRSMHQKNVEKIARMIGLLLRHNVDIAKIVKTLDNVDGLHVGSLVFRLKKFLGQFIKNLENGKRCPICNAPLVLKEGCEICENCNGYSKC